MSNVEGKIIVLGDVHGDHGRLNTFINKRRPKMILQCGDFGYWPNIVPEQKNKNFLKQYAIPKVQETKVYWADGNHENHWALRDIEDDEIWPNVFYMRRGSVLTLDDGRNVLFMGGATSIDKHMRKLGYDWFPEENIDYNDFNNLPDVNIDIVISHTCPLEFEIKNIGLIKMKDPSRVALSEILERYKPSLWYFGHFHHYETGYNNGCRWTCLADMRSSGAWEVLKD